MAPTPAAAVGDTPIVVICVSDTPDVEDVLFGSKGAADGARPGQLVIDCSTISPSATRTFAERLRERGVAMVDAPVSGGSEGAQKATLTIFCGGEAEDVERARPILEAFAKRVIPTGPTGSGHTMKLLNNFLSATTMAATNEAIAFGETVGLDMATMLEVLNASSGRSAATADKFPEYVLTRRYAAGFTNSLMAKDLRLYLAEVGGQGTPHEIGDLTVDLWQRFAAAEPGADFTRIFPFVAGAP
jgi:3-hydroxyisobutyrate dehydrogenase-like beta-hydroxyacid dehydrogenase